MNYDVIFNTTDNYLHCDVMMIITSVIVVDNRHHDMTIPGLSAIITIFTIISSQLEFTVTAIRLSFVP